MRSQAPGGHDSPSVLQPARELVVRSLARSPSLAGEEPPTLISGTRQVRMGALPLPLVNVSETSWDSANNCHTFNLQQDCLLGMLGIPSPSEGSALSGAGPACLALQQEADKT